MRCFGLVADQQSLPEDTRAAFMFPNRDQEGLLGVAPLSALGLLVGIHHESEIEGEYRLGHSHIALEVVRKNSFQHNQVQLVVDVKQLHPNPALFGDTPENTIISRPGKFEKFILVNRLDLSYFFGMQIGEVPNVTEYDVSILNQKQEQMKFFL